MDSVNIHPVYSFRTDVKTIRRNNNNIIKVKKMMKRGNGE